MLTSEQKEARAQELLEAGRKLAERMNDQYVPPSEALKEGEQLGSDYGIFWHHMYGDDEEYDQEVAAIRNKYQKLWEKQRTAAEKKLVKDQGNG